MNRLIANALLLCVCSTALLAQPRSAGAPKLLLRSAEGLMAPAWSPRGDKIAVTTGNYVGILVADADGTHLTRLTDEPGAGFKMQWSADGSRLLGRTNVADGGLISHEVKVWDVAGAGATVLVGKTRQLKGMPLWAGTDNVAFADSRGDAVVDRRSRKRAPSRHADAYTLMVSDPAGVADRMPSLKQFSGKVIINPAPSPDGGKVAFQVPGRGIYTCRADGSEVAFLCKGSHPAWLPDGSVVYTVVTDDGLRFTGSTLRAISTATKATVTLLDDDDFVPMCPTAAPGGQSVAFENAKDASIYVITLKY